MCVFFLCGGRGWQSPHVEKHVFCITLDVNFEDGGSFWIMLHPSYNNQPRKKG